MGRVHQIETKYKLFYFVNALNWGLATASNCWKSNFTLDQIDLIKVCYQKYKSFWFCWDPHPQIRQFNFYTWPPTMGSLHNYNEVMARWWVGQFVRKRRKYQKANAQNISKKWNREVWATLIMKLQILPSQRLNKTYISIFMNTAGRTFFVCVQKISSLGT